MLKISQFQRKVHTLLMPLLVLAIAWPINFLCDVHWKCVFFFDHKIQRVCDNTNKDNLESSSVVLRYDQLLWLCGKRSNGKDYKSTCHCHLCLKVDPISFCARFHPFWIGSPEDDLQWFFTVIFTFQMLPSSMINCDDKVGSETNDFFAARCLRCK